MGLMKAIGGAVSGVLADQWREYIYCDALAENVLVKKGQKRVSASRTSNTKGEENIISNGSIVAVNEGQCMIIVDQGKVVEFCAEAGEFQYDTSTEPSLFAGKLGTSIADTFKNIGKRFTFGGDTARDQRVYYFNTKEILGNRYGTPSPVPFRVVDQNIGLDIDIAIRCFGEYSYKITDPLLFYANVCGNVTDNYTRDRIDGQLKTELMTALQPALARISAMGVRYSALPGHTQEIADALNDVLSAKWAQLRGIQISSFGINSVKASEEDEEMIKNLQRTAVMRDPSMAAATLTAAQAQAVQDAARNTAAGPMFAFAGMDMANRAGGVNAQSLYQMAQQNQSAQTPATSAAPAANAESWTCACGAACTGKFCPQCGAKKPEAKPAEESWKCSACGHENTGRFCMECGTKKPTEARLYRCDKCGWEPADPEHPPKFCPECGDPFDDSDAK